MKQSKKYDAYLIAKINMPHPNNKKKIVFNKDTPIKVDPLTGEAFIGPYALLLFKVDYSLVN